MGGEGDDGGVGDLGAVVEVKGGEGLAVVGEGNDCGVGDTGVNDEANGGEAGTSE